MHRAMHHDGLPAPVVQPVHAQHTWCLAVCRYGYRGFYDRDDKPVVLTRRSVDGIQLQGGTILGTSRGGADIKWGPQHAAHAVDGSQSAGRPHGTACTCIWLLR